MKGLEDDCFDDASEPDILNDDGQNVLPENHNLDIKSI